MTTRAIVCVLVLSACIPTEFDDLRGTSPTVALAPPDDYEPRGFGSVLTGYGGDLTGTFASRIAISAGAGSPYTIYPLMIGEELDLDTPVLDGCNDEYRCDPSAGRSLAGVPSFGTRQMCIVVPEPELATTHTHCEDDRTSPGIATSTTGVRLGWTAVGVPRAHPFGSALAGAPGEGDGALYRLTDRWDPYDIPGAMLPADGNFGNAIAIGVLDDDSVIVAAAATEGAMKRVVVAVTDVAVDGTLTTNVHACIDDASDNFGLALAIGDLNGDGMPEVVVGNGPGEDRANVVRVYDGASMPAAGTCDGSWTAFEISCPTLDGVSCPSSSLFGSALAIGDVDADGVGDLIVGEPSADVGDVGGAGAVFVFHGGGTIEELDDTVVAVHHSSPRDGAQLGATVAAVPGAIADMASGRRRDELAAGAPGVDRVYVFLCSGLPGDNPADTNSTQCQPQ